MFDRLRDSFERLGPRERRLASWLGVVVLVCGLAYVGFLITDGLTALERDNGDLRLLLVNLEEKRDQLAADASKKGEIVAMIGEEAPALGSYIEKVAGEINVPIKATNDRPVATKGKFRELSSEITLYDISVDQLAKLLHGLETANPTVVTQKLDIRRSAMTKEKFDRVVITVATYERVKSAKVATPPGAAAAGAAAPAAEPAAAAAPAAEVKP
jgi:Type II secretion system (T2SS), protein M subtype b